MNGFRIPSPENFQQAFSALLTVLVLSIPLVMFATGKDVPNEVWSGMTFVVGVWLDPPAYKRMVE